MEKTTYLLFLGILIILSKSLSATLTTESLQDEKFKEGKKLYKF